jgi:hypothetical protein
MAVVVIAMVDELRVDTAVRDRSTALGAATICPGALNKVAMNMEGAGRNMALVVINRGGMEVAVTLDMSGGID